MSCLSVGADACRGGWVGVELADGRFARACVVPSFGELLRAFPAAAAVGVDIPIGLPDAGPRAADVEARAFVGPRRSSVFPTPPRGALEATTAAAGRRVWPSLSAQSYALRSKIFEVEHCLEARVFEVHPEVSFAALAGRYLADPKRSWNGQMERRRLLAGAGIELPDALPTDRAAVDDVLDAAVAAWSATRWTRGEARTLPAEAPLQHGRHLAIWY